LFAERAYGGRDSFGIEAVFVAELLSSENAAERNAISKCESLRERLLKDFAAHRVRTRLQNSPETAIRPATASGLNRGAHGRGMVREVVYHENTVMFPFDIEAAANGKE
jgi:hypothetical protein